MLRSAWVPVLALFGWVAACSSEGALPARPTSSAASGSGGGGGGGSSASTSGSGGAGSGGDDGPVAMIFPPPVALTHEDAITVRGTTEAGRVALVRVNGVPATSDDGFATWSLKIPLELGDNVIEVAATAPGALSLGGASATVRRSDPLWIFSHSLTLDEAQSLAYLWAIGDGYASEGVWEIDLASQRWRSVSNVFSEIPLGCDSLTPVALAFDQDAGRVLVLTSDCFYAVDPADGSYTMINDSLPNGFAPSGMVYDAVAGRAIVIDDPIASASAVRSIDVATGTMSVLSDAVQGNGIAIDGGLEAIALAAADHRIFVLHDGSFDQIVAVDLATGNRSLVSDATLGSGPPLISPVAMAFSASSSTLLLVQESRGYLQGVDVDDGERRWISIPEPTSAGGIGKGLAAGYVRGLATRGGEALLLDSLRDGLITVDVVNGDRLPAGMALAGEGPLLIGAPLCLDPKRDRIVTMGQRGEMLAVSDGSERTVLSWSAAAEKVGEGPPLTNVKDIAIDDVTGEAFVAMTQLGILQVDMTSGDRKSIAEDGLGSGPSVLAVNALALGPAGELWAGTNENGDDAILQIERASGDRQLISGPDLGTGQPLSQVTGLAFDGTRLLATTPSELVAIEIDTGDRIILSSTTVGSGALLNGIRDLALEADGQHALVIQAQAQVLRVDLTSGDRVLLASAHPPGTTTGIGPIGGSVERVAYEPSGLLWSSELGLASLLVHDLTSGERVISSR